MSHTLYVDLISYRQQVTMSHVSFAATMETELLQLKSGTKSLPSCPKYAENHPAVARTIGPICTEENSRNNQENNLNLTACKSPPQTHTHTQTSHLNFPND